MSTRSKWLLLSPVSLFLIGYGLCVFGDATVAKHEGMPLMHWVVEGSYSLILINGGLCLLGQAIRFRVMLDTRRIVRREIRKHEKERLKKRKAAAGAKG